MLMRRLQEKPRRCGTGWQDVCSGGTSSGGPYAGGTNCQPGGGCYQVIVDGGERGPHASAAAVPPGFAGSHHGALQLSLRKWRWAWHEQWLQGHAMVVEESDEWEKGKKQVY